MTTPNERFDAASSAEAAPKVWSGGVTCDTPQSIERFRMITCLAGLKLESQGIRVHRGVSCLAVARRNYGIHARTAGDAWTKMHAIMTARGIIVK